MKTAMILKATGLTFLVGAMAVMASPAPGAGQALSLTERTASYDANAAVDKRQWIIITSGINGVLRYATETFAAQIEGAATSIGQLKKLCAHAPQLTSRLATQGYNTTYITNQICEASKQPELKNNTEIQSLTQQASSKIWVVQALGSMGSYAKLLCNAYDVEAGNQIGHDGEFVKRELCGVSG